MTATAHKLSRPACRPAMATCRCCGSHRSMSRRARSSASSARTAPARPRCCAAFPGCSRPTAGDIAVDGRRSTQATPADFVRAGVAHVPEGRRLFSAMSVRDNLLMGAYLRTTRRHRRRSRARLRDVPDPGRRRRQDAGTLSGGEQQMCAIGRGMMARPRLLMIDELSLGLAPRVVELLTERLREINRPVSRSCWSSRT